MNIALLESLADLLIPAGGDMPSASQADVGRHGISQVLNFRPELKAALESVLKECEGKTARDALASLSAGDFATLAEMVASAYFMNEDVRAKLHYHGQRAKPMVPEEIEAELLKPVIERGAIYRKAD